MKTIKARNAALALLGLLALSVYILACTSFSPDDTKVLYPTFDKDSGAIGMAVYDRETRRSELLFLPIAYDNGQSNAPAPQILRGLWLRDGHEILLTWYGGKDGGDETDLAVAPWGARMPFKVFRLPGIKDAGTLLTVPPCVAGTRVFVRAGPAEVLRLDLNTGAVEGHEFKDIKGEISLYPVPDGAGVFYAESRDEPRKSGVFGRLNPDDFSRTPFIVITNEVADESFFTYDLEGKRVAFIEKSEDACRLVVLGPDKAVFTRPIGGKNVEMAFGNAGFFPKGNMLWAAFQKKVEGSNNASYGLMEIPLTEAPIRETILIADAPAGKDAAMYFQASVSHDGKTAAAASTYLSCTDKEIKPDDCALFLVDLGDPGRKVTRVPIAVPANRPLIK